jgi:hypothetical protein
LRRIFSYSIAAAICCLPTAGLGDGSDASTLGRSMSNRPLSGDNGVADTSPAAPDAAAGFPEPLGSQGRSSSETGPLSPNRKQAMGAYLRGREAASRNDFAAALGLFKKAYSLETSSTALFAIAQCQKALNRPIEALLTFAASLYEDNRMDPGDRLTEPFAIAARDHLSLLLRRLVAVRVVLPQGAELDRMLIGGIPVINTRLYGQLDHGLFLAGARAPGIPLEQTAFPHEFVFYTRRGVFDIDFILSDGRRLSIEKRRLEKGRDRIDLNRDPLPARIVVENIQPGTRIVVKAEGDVTVVDEKFHERQRELTIGELKQGAYDLSASRNGFDDFDAAYRVSRGQEERVYLDLQPKPLIKSWKLWLGVGLVTAAAIITTVVLTTRDKEAPPGDVGNGVITLDLLNP